MTTSSAAGSASDRVGTARRPGLSAPGRPGGAPAGTGSVREHNLALVLDVVAQHGPVSRARVAAHTGLTRGTVSSLVEELLENLLLSELAAERGGTGRPASPLQLNPHGPVGLGVEIGVDAVSACVVDLTGTVRAVRTEPSAHRTGPPANGLAHAVDVARTVVTEVGAPLLGAGVAVPGLVGRDGVLDRAPNLPGWADLDQCTPGLQAC